MLSSTRTLLARAVSVPTRHNALRAFANGTVKWFNITKGFGFITRHDCEDQHDCFVHQSQISSTGFRFLKEGEDVEFDVEDTERGEQAINVTGPDGAMLDRSFNVEAPKKKPHEYHNL